MSNSLDELFTSSRSRSYSRCHACGKPAEAILALQVREVEAGSTRKVGRTKYFQRVFCAEHTVEKFAALTGELDG